MQYRVMDYQPNRNTNLNSSRGSIKGGRKDQTPEITQRVVVSELPSNSKFYIKNIQAVQKNVTHNCQVNLSTNTLIRSGNNPSIRANTQIKSSFINAGQSYFHDPILESKQSFESNRNNPNPEIETHMSKSRQSYRSKTCQDNRPPNIVIYSPKIHTSQQKAKSSVSSTSNKQHKSMNLSLRRSQLDKSKSEKPISKLSSIKCKSGAQASSNRQNNSQQKLFTYVRQDRTQHTQFFKRLTSLITRNQEINTKYRQIEDYFEKTNEENKRMMQCQLNQIYHQRENLTKQYKQRALKINTRTKTNFSKVTQQVLGHSLHQSRLQNTNKQISQVNGK